MAKSKASGSFPWLETLGVGVAAFAVYKIFFSATPATTPTGAAPVPGATAASIPVTPASAPPVASIPARGPGYQGWLNTIQGYNEQFLSGAISLPVLQQKLSQARLAINEDYAHGRLTSSDVDDLNSDITSYGG